MHSNKTNRPLTALLAISLYVDVGCNWSF